MPKALPGGRGPLMSKPPPPHPLPLLGWSLRILLQRMRRVKKKTHGDPVCSGPGCLSHQRERSNREKSNHTLLLNKIRCYQLKWQLLTISALCHWKWTSSVEGIDLSGDDGNQLSGLYRILLLQKALTCIFSFAPHGSSEEGIIVPTLQMRKLSPKQVSRCRLGGFWLQILCSYHCMIFLFYCL